QEEGPLSQQPWSHVLHEKAGERLVEVTSEGVVVQSSQGVLDLIANLVWGNEASGLILHERHVNPSFFDLSTGIAGEIIQKCTNYRVRLGLVGDCQRSPSKSLQAVIVESNRGSQVYFADTLEEAVDPLARP